MLPSLCIFALFVAGQYTSALELKLCANIQTQDANCKFLESVSKEFKCVLVEDSVDCQNRLESGQVDFGVFTAEEALVAAADKKDRVVVAEVRHQNRRDDAFDFRTVAVVRANHSNGIAGLKGKQYCHPGFSRTQYWTDPVLKALEKEVLKTQDNCNETISKVEFETMALSQFFGKSCRPGDWTVNSYRDGKLKSKYSSLCALCDNGFDCTYNTQQVGSHIAAMSCLTERGGDVVYNALGVVREYFKSLPAATEGDVAIKEQDFLFLCPDGTTQPLSTASPCTWIAQPWPVILANRNNANTVNGKLKDMYPNELERSSVPLNQRLKTILAGESGIFRISTANPLDTVTNYVTKGRSLEEKRQCGEDIKWCTTSEEEKKKCQAVAVAARTHGISPQISCPPPSANVTACLRQVNQSDFDIAVIPTTDGFAARSAFNLQPVMFMESERSSNYYGIIVVPVNSTVRNIKDLKGKSACFPKFNGLGWLTYLKTAWADGELPKSACPTSPQTLSHFGRSCAPGVNDKNYNIANISTSHLLCQTCTLGKRGGNCEASTSNPYYGEVGAIRCLGDGAGHAAFLDLNTIIQAIEKRGSGFSKKEVENLRVLCKDGSKAEITKDLNVEKCARIQVIGTEVVTRKATVGRVRDIQYALEEINNWFGFSRNQPIIRLFGKYNNASNVLLPSHGVDLINIHETDGSFVHDYADLHSKLQHCSAANSLIPGLLMSLVAAFLFF